MTALSVHSARGGATRVKPCCARGELQPLAQVQVRRHAAGDDQRAAGRDAPPAADAWRAPSGRPARRRPRPGSRRTGRPWSAGSAAAWPRSRMRWRTAVLSPEKEKSQVLVPCNGRGRSNRSGSPPCASALDGRAARVAEPQHLRDLVERLADRIVDGGAEQAVAADALDRDQLAMAAGDQQQEIGEVELGHEAGGQRVRLEVVDRHQRQVVDQCHRLAGEQAHHQPADQPRTGGGGDPGEIAEADAGLAHRLGHQQVELLDMGAGCYLRHHAAIGGMLGELGEQGCRQHACGRRGPGPPPSRRSWSRSPRRCRRPAHPSPGRRPMLSRSSGNQP